LHIEKNKNEEFSVVKSYTVVNPGAVMIHV